MKSFALIPATFLTLAALPAHAQSSASQATYMGTHKATSTVLENSFGAYDYEKRSYCSTTYVRNYRWGLLFLKSSYNLQQYGRNDGPCSNTTDRFLPFDATKPTQITTQLQRPTRDFSKLTIDVEISHPSLKGMLSDANATSFVARYQGELKTCDGENVIQPVTPQSIQELIANLNQLDFGEFLSCEISLKLKSTSLALNQDAGSFLSKASPKETKRIEWKIVNEFNLGINQNDQLTLVSAPKSYDDYADTFSLKRVLKAGSNASKDSAEAFDAVENFVAEIRAYGETLLTSADPRLSPAERDLINQDALRRHKPELERLLALLKKEVPGLGFLDQLAVLRSVQQGYATVREIEQRIAGLTRHDQRLNLDIVIR